MNATTHAEQLHRSIRRTIGFVYRHSAALIAVSACWVVGSLPIVTIGPATLGAYAAIHARRNGNRSMQSVRTVLRRHGLNAALLGFVPVLIALVTVGYVRGYLVTDSIQYLLLSIAGVYLLSFLTLVVATTFVGLAGGNTFRTAIKDGYAWIIHEPVLATLTVLLSGVIVLVGIVSIVGLAIIVPAILFSFHTEVVRSSPNGRQSASHNEAV